MILIGQFDSPYVRRVAISMTLLGFDFEHRPWSVGKDFEAIRRFNPLGRVPTLVLDDGESLIESSAILDHIDSLAGPARALIPPSGPERRRTLRLLALMTGATEKAVLQLYERIFRPEEKRHEPWLERLRSQMHGALAELESGCGTRAAGEWLVGNRLTQADITLACALRFLTEALQLDKSRAPYPLLRALAARCEALPEFQSIQAEFVGPRS